MLRCRMETTDKVDNPQVKESATEYTTDPVTEQSPKQPNLIDRIPPEKRWQPGQSGNPAGRPPNKSSITYWYNKLLEDGVSAKKISAKALELAEQGSLGHLKEVTDRTDGRLDDQAIQIDNRTINIHISERGNEARKLIGEVTKE